METRGTWRTMLMLVPPAGRAEAKMPLVSTYTWKFLHPQAVGHDLHGLLGAEHLAAVLQQRLSGIQNQVQGRFKTVHWPRMFSRTALNSG